jgi:hypothetical protein
MIGFPAEAVLKHPETGYFVRMVSDALRGAEP